MGDVNVVRGDVEAAINEVLHANGELSCKWYLVVETLDENNERTLLALGSDDIQGWESIGMLRHALVQEEAEVVACREDD